MISTAIVDSGPLIAVANAADPDHRACLAALQTPRLHLVIPALCVAEAAYLIGRRQGAIVEARFLAGLSGFEIAAPESDEWARVGDLVERYADFPLGGTDAAVVTLAERYETDLVITLDRRHFSGIAPAHCHQLHLLPELPRRP